MSPNREQPTREPQPRLASQHELRKRLARLAVAIFTIDADEFMSKYRSGGFPSPSVADDLAFVASFAAGRSRSTTSPEVADVGDDQHAVLPCRVLR